MKEEFLVSVIVPVYNVEKYIVECIESIIKQTYSNLEILIINDGSNDESIKKCQPYLDSDDRVLLISKENGGLSSARNLGLKYMKGDYVTFIDSDDIVSIDMIERLIEMIKRSNSDIASIEFTKEKNELLVGEIESIHRISSKDAIKGILLEKVINTSASGKLYKSSLWKNIVFPEGRIFEDYATIYKVLQKAVGIAVSSDKKYYYRTNPDGITQAIFSDKRMDYFIATDEIKIFIDTNYPDLQQYLKNRTTRYAISFFRDISKGNYENQVVIQYLIKKISSNIYKYLKSDYSLLSKMYGLCISWTPNIALKIFKSI